MLKYITLSLGLILIPQQVYTQSDSSYGFEFLGKMSRAKFGKHISEVRKQLIQNGYEKYNGVIPQFIHKNIKERIIATNENTSGTIGGDCFKYQYHEDNYHYVLLIRVFDSIQIFRFCDFYCWRTKYEN